MSAYSQKKILVVVKTYRKLKSNYSGTDLVAKMKRKYLAGC